MDDLEVQRLALMIGASKACTCAVDEDVVPHDGLALHLHDIVAAVVAEIALNDVHRLARRAIDGDAGVVRVVDVILRDQIAPGALLHLDAVALITATVVNVIQSNHTFAHDVVAVVGTEIHALGMSSAVVDVIAGQKEALGVGTVGTEADFIGVMDVALIDPNIATMPEAQAVAATGDFDPLKTQILQCSTLADVDDVLLCITACDDDLCTPSCHDPDRRIRRATGQYIPHVLDAVSSSGEFQLVARL